MSTDHPTDAVPYVPTSGLLDKERTIASRSFNRWLVPPAALAIHLSIGMAYGFSVFWLPLSRAAGSRMGCGCDSACVGCVDHAEQGSGLFSVAGSLSNPPSPNASHSWGSRAAGRARHKTVARSALASRPIVRGDRQP